MYYIKREISCVSQTSRKYRLEASDTHKSRDLTYGDIDRGAGHEAGDSGYRDKFHDPAKAEQSNAKDDEPAYECYVCGDIGA